MTLEVTKDYVNSEEYESKLKELFLKQYLTLSSQERCIILANLSKFYENAIYDKRLQKDINNIDSIIQDVYAYLLLTKKTVNSLLEM